MIKIRRRKPIFEDDQNTTQQSQPAATPAPAQPAAQPQQNNTQTPQQPATNTQQPNQTQDQNNNQQQQQNQPQDQNQQQQQPNPNAQKVQDTLKQMENTWWMISVNLPEEIQKNIPDFKQGNQQADAAIKAWNDFKQNPSEDTFKTFLNGFKTFGGLGDGQNNANGNNGQQQPQQNTTQNSQQSTSAQQPQQNVNAGLKAAYSFKKNLMENLAIAKKKQYYNSICEDFFDKTEFTL